MNTAKTGLTCAIKDRELTLTKVKNFPKGSKEAAYTKDIIYNLIHRYILLGGNSIKIIDESTESIKQCKKTYVGFDVVCKEL